MSALLQRLTSAGLLLGFALGGFFDGILLHQILQWHHLLSGIDRPPFDDLHAQILADGLFHALMYVIAVAGLWKLMRARRAAEAAGGRMLAAQALVGFGAWHVVDSLLSHWLLGIHRIRMDVPNPLFWDLLWFFLFGVLFIAAGLLLMRRRTPPLAAMHGMLAPWLAALTVAAGAVAARPPDAATVTVLLRPDATPATLLAGLRDSSGSIVWNSPRGDVWVLAFERRSDAYRLYAHGALLVSGTLLPAGCSAWTRI